jgi:hypothetical protein
MTRLRSSSFAGRALCATPPKVSAEKRRMSPDMKIRWFPTVNGKVVGGLAMPLTGFTRRVEAIEAARVHAGLASPMWPRDKLLLHGPELPMSERVRRYQHNIREIRASGCPVPTVAMPDTLDAIEIETWFIERAAFSRRLRQLMRRLAKLPDDTMIPVGLT